MKKELEESDARYTIIGAGITILPDDRWEEHFFENTREFIKGLRNPKTSNKKKIKFFLKESCSFLVTSTGQNS